MEKKVFSGRIFDIYQWDQEMYDGTVQIFERAVRKNMAAGAIVMVDGRIVVQEQQQPHLTEAFFSLPGGCADSSDELPLEVVRREVLEESGYVSDDIIEWRTYRGAKLISQEQHFFIMRNCRKVAEMQLDAGEKIINHLYTLDEFLDLAEHPQFRHTDLRADMLLMKIYPERYAEFAQLLKGE